MTKKDFEAFLENKALEAEPKDPVDWQMQKKTWLESLNGFYKEIDSWLKDYITGGKIAMEHREVPITEDYIGRYMAPSRMLKIGASEVLLRPIGTLLLGARGRVDMEGPKGTVKFVLTGKHSSGVRIKAAFGSQKNDPPVTKQAIQEEQVWKIATPPPRVRFIELTSQSFFQSLMDVIDG